MGCSREPAASFVARHMTSVGESGRPLQPPRWTQHARSTEVVMAMYRMAWRWSVLLAGVAGVWVAMSAWSLGGALVLFLFIGSNAACIRCLMSRGSEARLWRKAMRAGLASGALVLGACGLVAWLGLQGLIVVAVLTLLSPTVLTTAVRRSHGRPRSDRSRPVRADVNGHAPDPTTATRHTLLDAPWMKQPTTSMDDATLCFAWRVSFVALQQPVPPFSRLQIVDRRHEFLDELERRNPRGFQAWLASGARAAADPTKYVSPAQHEVNRHDRR